MNLFDILFPNYCLGCGRIFSIVCNKCITKIDYLPSNFTKGRFDNLKNVEVISPLDNFTNHLIESYKKEKIKDLSKFFAELMIDNFDFQKLDILTFVPTDKKRKNDRGFDHLELIAKEIKKRSSIKILKLLEKKNHTSKQQYSDKEERLKKLSGAVFLKTAAKELPSNQNIGIFDDVITTGATLQTCQTVLHKLKPKKIYYFAIAHTIF